MCHVNQAIARELIYIADFNHLVHRYTRLKSDASIVGKPGPLIVSDHITIDRSPLPKSSSHRLMGSCLIYDVAYLLRQRLVVTEKEKERELW